jgi:hypothetical protein
MTMIVAIMDMICVGIDRLQGYLFLITNNPVFRFLLGVLAVFGILGSLYTGYIILNSFNSYRNRKLGEIKEYKELDKEIEKLNECISDFSEPNSSLVKLQNWEDYSGNLRCAILNNRLKELKKRYNEWYDWFIASQNCIGFAVANSVFIRREGLESEYEKNYSGYNLGAILIYDLTKTVPKELKNRKLDELKDAITVDWYKGEFSEYEKISKCDIGGDFPLILSDVNNKVENDPSLKNLVKAKHRYIDSYEKLKKEIDAIKWWQLWKFYR